MLRNRKLISFDWAIKRILRSKANFEILEGFLSELLKEEVCFLDFSIFGKLANVANNYLKKGSKVLLDGRLILEQWTAQDGTTKSKHSLRVETLKMLDSNPNNSTYQNNNSSNLDKSNAKIQLDKEFLEDLEKCPF